MLWRTFINTWSLAPKALINQWVFSDINVIYSLPTPTLTLAISSSLTLYLQSLLQHWQICSYSADLYIHPCTLGNSVTTITSTKDTVPIYGWHFTLVKIHKPHSVILQWCHDIGIIREEMCPTKKRTHSLQTSAQTWQLFCLLSTTWSCFCHCTGGSQGYKANICFSNEPPGLTPHPIQGSSAPLISVQLLQI